MQQRGLGWWTAPPALGFGCCFSIQAALSVEAEKSSQTAARRRSVSLLPMSTGAQKASREALVRRGVALEGFTLSWMTVEAGVAVAAGIAAGSVALLAFGIDSVIELVAAFVVLQAFRAEQAGRTGGSDREQRALRVIGVTFFLLAAYIVADAGYTLIADSKPESSAAGIAVTAAALVVMPVLGAAKRRTGNALGSPMLLADAAESLFCAYLSAAVLIGLLLNAAFGWWWADPVAALAVVPLVIKEGLEALEGEGDE
jgi:divalent metal cation (Fe/Co/Zn/Cd) transporter